MVTQAVQMEHLLIEEAVQLLNRIEPWGVGRQLQQLNR